MTLIFEDKKPKNLLPNILLSLNLLAVVVLIFVLLKPGDTPEPPGPQPITDDVVAIMSEAEIARLEMEAQASEEIAKKLRSGEIKTSPQLYQWAKAYQDRIEVEAYKKINELNQKYLVEADKGYTPEQIESIAEFQSLKAQAKRKVAK